MADIANELDTSMTGMNSQEDEIADGMDELVISENESTIEVMNAIFLSMSFFIHEMFLVMI